jgi:gluconate 2-dehydrogenase gamma chain
VHQVTRRQLLASSAIALLLGSRGAQAALLKGGLPWSAGAGDPPAAVTPDGWHYFTPSEAATVEAFVDRLIPPDPQTPGGKDCGCAVFIDRQLAGPYGRNEAFYMMGPFQEGTKQQGPQSPLTIAQQYRKALSAFDAACRQRFGSKTFAALPDEQKDEVIKALEDGSFTLDGYDGKTFFTQILKDTQNGFLADPIYGGNKDMAAWKMIDFPAHTTTIATGSTVITSA